MAGGRALAPGTARPNPRSAAGRRSAPRQRAAATRARCPRADQAREGFGVRALPHAIRDALAQRGQRGVVAGEDEGGCQAEHRFLLLPAERCRRRGEPRVEVPAQGLRRGGPVAPPQRRFRRGRARLLGTRFGPRRAVAALPRRSAIAAASVVRRARSASGNSGESVASRADCAPAGSFSASRSAARRCPDLRPWLGTARARAPGRLAEQRRGARGQVEFQQQLQRAALRPRRGLRAAGSRTRPGRRLPLRAASRCRARRAGCARLPGARSPHGQGTAPPFAAAARARQPRPPTGRAVAPA